MTALLNRFGDCYVVMQDYGYDMFELICAAYPYTKRIKNY